MKLKLTLAAVAALFAMNTFASEVLLDVRTPAEIAETGVVQGALTADVKSPAFKSAVEALKLNPEDDVKIYCRSGVRAGKAAEMLQSMGFKHVENLGGYQDAAKKLNRPLVK